MFRIRIQWVWEGGALLAAYLHVQTHQYIRRGQCGRRGREGEEHTNAMCHLYGDRKMKSRCPSRDKCNDRCAECVCVCVCPLGDKALSLSLTRWFRQWQQARSTLQTPVTTTRSEMRIKLWKMEFRPNQKRITQAQISEKQWRKVGQKRAKQINVNRRANSRHMAAQQWGAGELFNCRRVIDSGSSSQQQYQAALAPQAVSMPVLFPSYKFRLSPNAWISQSIFIDLSSPLLYAALWPGSYAVRELLGREGGGHLASPSWPRHLTACSCICQRLTLGAFYTRTQIRMRMLHTPATDSRLQHFSHSIALATFSHRITRHGNHLSRQQIAPTLR